MTAVAAAPARAARPKSQLKALDSAAGFYRWEGLRSGRIHQIRKDVDRFGRTTWWWTTFHADGTFHRGEAGSWDAAYKAFQQAERDFTGTASPSGLVADVIQRPR